MTTFAYDTYYTINDTDGITFTFTDRIDGLPDPGSTVWWIWDDGQIREGHTFDNGVEISQDYYPYDQSNFVRDVTQAKAQLFDFRYGAPYSCQLSGDIYMFAGTQVQPPIGTQVQYTLSTPGIVYNGTVDSDGGININPGLPPDTEIVPYIIFVEANETINAISGASVDAIGLQWDGTSGPPFNLLGYDSDDNQVFSVITEKSNYVVTPLDGIIKDKTYNFTVNNSIPTTLPVSTYSILLQLVSTGVGIGNRIARFEITDNFGFDLLSLWKVGDVDPVTTFSGGGPYFYNVNFSGDASYYVTSETSVVSNIIKLTPSVIIEIESLSSTQAQITWGGTPPFTLYGGPDGHIETADFEYSFTNLESESEYIFHVEDSIGTTSNDLLILTPALPITITIGGLGPTSLLFSWTNGLGPFRADLSGTGYTNITSPYLITGLTPDTDYALTVYDVNNSPSQTLLLHTPLAVPPVSSVQFGMTWFFSP